MVFLDLQEEGNVKHNEYLTEPCWSKNKIIKIIKFGGFKYLWKGRQFYDK